MTQEFFVSNLCSWIPPQDDIAAAPKLEFCEPIFRRRLSQISKMTIQVVHNIFTQGAFSRNTKIVFASKRGEISREFKINKTLIEESSILPASFSLSTFNAPIALATIAEGLRGGYTAIYPSRGNFKDAVLSAAAPILCGKENQIVFVYADELVPEVYKDFAPQENFPMAFAALFSSQNSNNGVQCNLSDIPQTPQNFLDFLKG